MRNCLAILLTFMLVHFVTLEAAKRAAKRFEQLDGYSKLLGQNSMNKYCGESGDSCVFDNQCCEDFSCDRSGEGACKRAVWQNDGAANPMTSRMGGGRRLTTCISNMDCSSNECCKHFETGYFIGETKKYCSADCSSWTDDQQSEYKNMPPAGNHRGYNFWQQWHRRNDK